MKQLRLGTINFKGLIMSKKRHIDFIIHEDDSEVIVFRFLPRQSHCHSFDDDPPKTWEDVYKVYYSYKIFKRLKNWDNTYELFNCYCDECSVIDGVSVEIQNIIKGNKTVTVHHNNEEYVIDMFGSELVPMGNGVSWIINELGITWEGKYLYEVIMWRWDGVGYRFNLEKNELKAFGEYLNECCEHMLANGEPI